MCERQAQRARLARAQQRGWSSTTPAEACLCWRLQFPAASTAPPTCTRASSSMPRCCAAAAACCPRFAAAAASARSSASCCRSCDAAVACRREAVQQTVERSWEGAKAHHSWSRGAAWVPPAWGPSPPPGLGLRCSRQRLSAGGGGAHNQARVGKNRHRQPASAPTPGAAAASTASTACAQLLRNRPPTCCSIFEASSSRCVREASRRAFWGLQGGAAGRGSGTASIEGRHRRQLLTSGFCQCRRRAPNSALAVVGCLLA